MLVPALFYHHIAFGACILVVVPPVVILKALNWIFFQWYVYFRLNSYPTLHPIM